MYMRLYDKLPVNKGFKPHLMPPHPQAPLAVAITLPQDCNSAGGPQSCCLGQFFDRSVNVLGSLANCSGLIWQETQH